MVRYYFALLMIFISVYAMEQDNKLEVDSLSWPDVYIRHSKPWFKSLCNWAKCYYQMKVLYENAHEYQKKQQEQGNNNEFNVRGLAIMRSWLQWCKPELKKIIGDPDELYYKHVLYARRLLNVALKKNKFCLGKFLVAEGVDPLLDCGLHPALFYATDLQWAKLFLSAVGYNADQVSKNVSLITHVVDRSYPEEVLEFYLKNNGDPNFANADGNSLHWLVRASDEYYQNEDALLKKAKLLITHKVNINELNQLSGDTPLDQAHHVLNYVKEKDNKIGQNICEKLIALLRNHGAKTAQELKAAQQ